MNKELFREMQPKERELISKLLEPVFPGRDELSQQLEMAMVRTVDEDGCLEFLINSITKADQIKYAVPTEAEYEDLDGITVHVLLHMRGGIAKELEFYREDNARVQTWPNMVALHVFAPD
jgi:hypothetical protein